MAEWWENRTDVEDVSSSLPVPSPPSMAAPDAPGVSSIDAWWERLPKEVFEKVTAPDQSEVVMTGAEFMPEEYSFMDSVIIGAGRTGKKMMSGIEDLYYRAIGDDESRKHLAEKEMDDDIQYAKLQETNPVGTTVGEIIPYMAVPMGGAAAPGAYLSAATAKSLAGAAAIGGALGAAHYNEDVLSGALGGAAGGALGKGVGEAWRYWRGVGLGGPGKHAREFYELGPDMRLTPGERTGWEFMKRGELARETHALSGRASMKIKEDRQKAINKIAAEKIGMPGESSLTDEVIDAGAQRIKEEFEAFGNLPHQIDLLEDFLPAMSRIEDGIQSSITTGGDNARRVISNIVDQMKVNGGVISMADYQRYSSEIMEEASKAFRGMNKDPLTGFAMNDLKRALDSTVQRQLGAAGDADAMRAFQQARDKWRNLDIVQRSKVVQGNIAPSSVLPVIQRGTGKRRTVGLDFTDPMHIIGRFGRDYAPSSGSIVYGSSSGLAQLPRAIVQYTLGKAQTGALGGRSPVSAAVGGAIAPRLGVAAGSDREGNLPEPEPEEDELSQLLRMIIPYSQ